MAKINDFINIVLGKKMYYAKDSIQKNKMVAIREDLRKVKISFWIFFPKIDEKEIKWIKTEALGYLYYRRQRKLCFWR